MKELIFVITNADSGSAFMRGTFISKVLHKKGYKVSLVLDRDLNVADINEEKTVVFVKYDMLCLSKKIKERGGRVVFDVVDSKKHWLEHQENIDTIIAGSNVHIQHMKNISSFKGLFFRIPHVITNTCKDYELQYRRQLGNEIKKIGYVGTPSTFTDTNDFYQYCNENNMSWFSGMPTPRLGNNADMTMPLDLGCIHYTHEKQRFGGTITSTKPATKLMNFFSFGIPTLFTHYDAYVEEIVRYDYHDLLWCLCNSKQSMFDKINILKNNIELYKDLGEQSFQLSRNFHVSKIEKIYKPLLQFASI